MATPASSATSPSPPMPYHLPHPSPLQPSPLSPLHLHEQEIRKKAVQKFLARAEVSMVTRALRARLSYASYKAVHNVSHVPIRELEGQLLSQSQANSFNRTIAAKRKSAGSFSHYGNPGAGASSTAPRRPSVPNMPPPANSSSPPTLAGSSAHHRSSSTGSRPSTAGQSLYSSILAPPQVARTVLNASDPPVPPSSRPLPSPRVRTRKPSPKSAADGSRTHSKAKQPDKKAVASPERRKAKRASIDNKSKGKQRNKKGPLPVDPDGDVDMKAAATLTSLLLNHRSSIHATTHSPRSSIDGSETGSTYSYSHFAQSSARSTTATSPPGSISSISAMTGAPESSSSYRQQTPPPPVNVQQHNSTTPRPSAPTDNEAADLMLFLATSPSPARPTPAKPRRDPSTYRTLGNDPTTIRNKGRILFPSSSAPDVMLHDDTRGTSRPSHHQPITTLARMSDGNYALTTHGTAADLAQPSTSHHRMPSSSSLLVTPTPGQLLPPASLPPASSRTPENTSSPRHKDGIASPKSGGTSDFSFNFNEFINASPSLSPTRGPPPSSGRGLGLRADVGRKLFEEEQIIRHSSSNNPSPP